MSVIVDTLLSYADAFAFDQSYGSNIAVPIVAALSYLIVIYSIQYYVRVYRDGKGFNVQLSFAYHNLFLSILSLFMLVCGCYVFVDRMYRESPSIVSAFCEGHNPAYFDSTKVNVQLVSGSDGTFVGVSGRYYAVVYVYYLSKYVELMDTVYLALRGRLSGWGGLNVYHHFCVLFMVWNWLTYAQSLQHIGLLCNTGVHVVMYYYFFLTGVGRKPRWKKYVTCMQIVQFVFSVCCLIPFAYYQFVDATTSVAGCAGSRALLANAVFNITLLGEFVTIFNSRGAKTTVASRVKESEDGVEIKKVK